MAGFGRYAEALIVCRALSAELERSGKLKFPIPVIEALLPLIEQRIAGTKGAAFSFDLIRCEGEYDQYYSMLCRYGNRADIFYSFQLNLCWSRFAICKEAAHLLIDDDPAHVTTDAISLIQQLITLVPMPGNPHVIQSEVMALAAALELLLPWKIRGELFVLRDGGKTDREIAEYTKVPEKYVNVMLRSSHGELSATVNRDLDTAAAAAVVAKK